MEASRPVVYTRHQLLNFPDLVPGTRYNLPFFWHHSMGDVLFTDKAGVPMQFCQDTIYEALDHRLIWIDYDGLALEEREVLKEKSKWDPKWDPCNGIVSVNFYFGCDGEHGTSSSVGHRIAEDVSKEGPGCRQGELPPERVLLLADFFRNRESFKSCWEFVLPTKFSIVDCPVPSSAPTPHGGPAGCALRLCPQEPKHPKNLARRRFAREDLCDLVDSHVHQNHRLHLRAYLYDTGAGAGCHFVAITSKLGAGAVGMFSADGKHCSYGFLGNFGVDFPEPGKWQNIAVVRAKGWHTFELVLQDMQLLVTVDDEPITKLSLRESKPSAEEHVWLGASGSPCAMWGGVELLHTPIGHGTWEMGVQHVRPGNRRPWRIHCDEEGTWEVDADSGIVKKTSEDEPELPPRRKKQQVVEAQNLESAEPAVEAIVEDHEPAEQAPAELEETPPADEPVEAPADELVEAPEEKEEPVALPEEAPEEAEEPAVLPKRTKAPPKRSRSRASPRLKGRGASPPPTKDPFAGLVIDCWTVPGETELQRLDRLMDVFLDKLREADIPVPENIRRIEKCSQPEHESCYVYSFGTRRLHVAAREGEAGRITLVVRIGGGFIDFLEFVRRNGSLEKLRFERRPDSKGHEHICLSSVMRRGKMEVREMPARNCTNCTAPVAAHQKVEARSLTAPSISTAPDCELTSPVLETPEMEEEILGVFKHFDKNKDGFIDPEELSQVLKGLDPEIWTGSALGNLLQAIDTNEDGLINYSELVAWSYCSDFRIFTDAARSASVDESMS